MNQEAQAAAGSVGFLIVCIPMVLVTLFQAIFFMKKAWKNGLDIGMPKEKLVRGLRSGTITAIAPSFAVLIALVGLIAIVGPALAWLRLSVIGAIMFEGLAADTALTQMGTAVGDAGYGVDAFACIVWVMAIASSGWLILTGLFTHKLEGIRTKVVAGREYLLPVVSVGACLGCFGYQTSKFVITLSRSTISALVSAAVMIVLTIIANKTKIGWIKEWSLGIAMVCGMFAAVIGLQV